MHDGCRGPNSCISKWYWTYSGRVWTWIDLWRNYLQIEESGQIASVIVQILREYASCMRLYPFFSRPPTSSDWNYWFRPEVSWSHVLHLQYQSFLCTLWYIATANKVDANLLLPKCQTLSRSNPIGSQFPLPDGPDRDVLAFNTSIPATPSPNWWMRRFGTSRGVPRRSPCSLEASPLRPEG
jgi:hypothetical protein